MHYIDFTITQSSIDNGRLYFDAAHTSFFTTDVIGGRGAREHALANVRIDAAGETYDTDMRFSSSVRISPRKSFKRWLAAVRVVEGGQARLSRIAEDHFKLEYLG